MRKAAAGSLALMLLCTPAGAGKPWQAVRRIADFDRFDLVQPDLIYAVRKASELKVAGTCVTGGVECDLQVPETGWYELLAEPAGGLNEFIVDGRLSVWAGQRRKRKATDRYGKVDNLWLAKGRHTIRVQRYIWWGFYPPTRSILLRRSGPGLAGSLRVEYAHGPGEAVVRRGEDLRLTVHTAGRKQPAALTVQLREKQSGRVDSAIAVDLPATEGPRTIPVRLPCGTEGIFEVRFGDGRTPISTADLKPMTVYAIDTAPARPAPGELRKALLQEIDCAEKRPDYVSGGPTRVVAKPFGKYRLSGNVGCLYAQHHNTKASWFAYKVRTPDVGKPHVLEVTYPDDADRTFLIVLRESSADAYPVAGGVDSGGCWSLSNTMLTQSILFWPKTPHLRVVLAPPHNGTRAAAARIRLYRVDGELPLLPTPASGGRTFLNWYEEGSNFTGFYGGSKGNLDAYLKSSEMWLRALRYVGGNLILPTVSIYQMSLYPSRHNHHHAEMMTADLVRLLLLRCEKYGVRLAAEFHPEARELEYPWALRDRRANGLVSRTGKVSTFGTNGPSHHPLHPRNRAWMLGMVGELADRYKDSPAFAGVSLRCMSWTNPSLNNFHSLDWGYDDLCVGRFERDTGVDVAVAPHGPGRFAQRHDWLMKHARQRWIDWRCEKVAELHRAVVARVRRARKDLVVYVTLFDLGKEAGLDAARLSAIDGLVPINCRHSYGRQARTYEGYLADQAMRDKLLDPVLLRSTCGASGAAGFLFGARYFEATERVLKPTDMGLPAEGKAKWVSGVVNPAGRHYLERYAVALAETDALLLGDGGNAYTLGQPLLREFTREFRHLPAVRFAPRKDARDPVAVWELARRKDFLFYAVNRERYPVGVTVSMKAGGPVRRLATGAEARLEGDRLALQLQPYQLIAFQAPAGARITGVSTVVPPEARARVEAMVGALAKLGEDVKAGRAQLDDAGGKLLASALAEARRCLREQRFWRARTLLEHHELARRVYNPLLAYPPGLAHLIAPRRMRILKARNLTRPTDPLVHVAFDSQEGGAIPVAGKLRLRATCQGPCRLAEGKYGKAVHLDGKTARVVLAGPDAAGLNLKDLTICAWVNPESVGERRGIVLKQKWPSGYALFFWNGSVAAEAGSPAGTAQCRTPDSFCRPGVWTHLAMTVESGKAITLYVDGEAVKKAPAKRPTGAVDAPLLIGWNGWGGRQNDSSPGPFVGRIDELRIWGRALSANEVLAEMAGKR